MRKASKIELCFYSSSSKSRLFSAFVVLSALLSTPGTAQRSVLPFADAQSSACYVFFAPPVASESPQSVKQLFAKCGGNGVSLGAATSFDVFSNEASQATLVDARTGPDRRVLLLTLQDDGRALVEDLTGQIARAAGRGPFSKIDGIELDFKQFARTGDVGVGGRPDDRSRARTDHISISQQVASERARRAARKITN